MNPILIRTQDCVPQAWRNGGGQTRELLAWPPGDPADPWQLRISRADIDRDGPFSAFPGVQRWFAVLQGNGVALQMDREHLLRAGDAPLKFNGGAAPGCRLLNGPTQDLNLMVRGGLGDMHTVVAGQTWSTRLDAGGLYTCHSGHWSDGKQTLHLEAHTLLWHERPRKAVWEFTPDHEVPALCAYWLGFSPQSATQGGTV